MITVLLGPPAGRKLWRLSVHWIADPKVQEDMPEAICHYWLENADLTEPLIVWDAFK